MKSAVPETVATRSAAMPRDEELVHAASDHAGGEPPETWRGCRSEVSYLLAPGEVPSCARFAIRDR